MLKSGTQPLQAANDAVRSSAGSEDQPPSPRGRRGGRKHRKREGPDPLAVGCPDCKREKGRHCTDWHLTKTFHPARIVLASRTKVRKPKRVGDYKRALRRLNAPPRVSAPDSV